MKMVLRCALIFILFLAAAITAVAQVRAVIDDPDGFVNLRDGKSTSSAVIAKVKKGVAFTLEPGADGNWVQATLRSGQTGWMHKSRVKLLFSEDDLCKRTDAPDDNTELAHFGKSQGVDYYAVTKRAIRGDAAAQKQFFGFAETVDGGAAEGYSSDLAVVMHLLGDEKLSRFLSGQDRKFRKRIAQAILEAWELTGMVDAEYFARHFPMSAGVLR